MLYAASTELDSRAAMHHKPARLQLSPRSTAYFAVVSAHVDGPNHSHVFPHHRTVERISSSEILPDWLETSRKCSRCSTSFFRGATHATSSALQHRCAVRCPRSTGGLWHGGSGLIRYPSCPLVTRSLLHGIQISQSQVRGRCRLHDACVQLLKPVDHSRYGSSRSVQGLRKDSRAPMTANFPATGASSPSALSCFARRVANRN